MALTALDYTGVHKSALLARTIVAAAVDRAAQPAAHTYVAVHEGQALVGGPQDLVENGAVQDGPGLFGEVVRLEDGQGERVERVLALLSLEESQFLRRRPSGGLFP